MDRGLSRIVDQTVDRKVVSVIEPAIESAVFKVLGVDKANDRGLLAYIFVCLSWQGSAVHTPLLPT